MTRAAAIAAAEAYFDDGGFVADLARRVAIPTESQVEERLPVLRAYLADEIAPSLARLGFVSEIVDNPVRGGPMLIAERREAGASTTVFGYGHGDVIRGLDQHAALKPSRPRTFSTLSSAARLIVCWPLLSAVPRP